MSTITVYAICNHATGEAYIGQTRQLKARWYQHRSQLRRGCHSNSALQDAWTSKDDEGFTLVIVERVEVSDAAPPGCKADWAQEARWLARARAAGITLYNDQVGRRRAA